MAALAVCAVTAAHANRPPAPALPTCPRSATTARGPAGRGGSWSMSAGTWPTPTGARVLAGGRARPDLGPYFYEPTVLAGVTEQVACHGEETFGPVVSVYLFVEEQEAVRLAHTTPSGPNASEANRGVAR